VQSLIYKVDLAYQPDGRLAVDANASKACDIPDRGHARVADGRIQPAQEVSQGASVNKEYLSQIQLYSMFGELPVISNTVLIITVCVKVANSTFLVTNKRTKWAELSRYYLYNCFVRLF